MPLQLCKQSGCPGWITVLEQPYRLSDGPGSKGTPYHTSTLQLSCPGSSTVGKPVVPSWFYINRLDEGSITLT
jgi:hypothetical protein